MITVLLVVVLPLVLLLVGGGVGALRERRHLADLDRREREAAGFVVTDLRHVPAGMTAHNARLVVGEVVVASDYLKSFSASLRALVGGEVRAFRNVMGRGRREARLRMLDQAGAHGADLVINVRFATSMIVGGSAEILCYGTAMRTDRG